MKVKIPKYKLEKILIEDNEYELPDEPAYYFETCVRRSIRFIPILTSWKHEKDQPEEIYQYHITVVYLSFENKIESFKISAKSGLSDLMKDGDKSEQSSVIKALFNKYLNVRTKEQFEADLQQAINNLSNYE